MKWHILPRSRSLFKFFLLVFVLSIPFWLLGAVTGLQLMPGLPLSALMTFCPLIAASILTYQENRTKGVNELLRRAMDYKRTRAKIWYIPIALLMPGVAALSYGIMRLTGMPLSAPHISVISILVLFVAFFIAALGEELGWSGYALDPMQERWSALWAGILLGVIWAAWHIVPLVQVHRPTAWIVWWCLFTVSLRIIMVWLYNNTGKSVFAVTIFHAISNITTLLFVGYYDPHIAGVIMVFAAVIVTIVWGPGALTRNRSA